LMSALQAYALPGDSHRKTQFDSPVWRA